MTCLGLEGRRPLKAVKKLVQEVCPPTLPATCSPSVLRDGPCAVQRWSGGVLEKDRAEAQAPGAGWEGTPSSGQPLGDSAEDAE